MFPVPLVVGLHVWVLIDFVESVSGSPAPYKFLLAISNTHPDTFTVELVVGADGRAYFKATDANGIPPFHQR